MVGELKKGRYVYYHCTGYKGKCGEPYVREEVIAEKFAQALGRLNFGDDVLQWVTFDLIAEATMLELSGGTGGGENPSTHPKWLPGPDSNQRPTG
jgi:hypothetical protein